MFQYQICKATILQEIGEVEKSRQEVMQLVCLGVQPPGQCQASDVTAFRVK